MKTPQRDGESMQERREASQASAMPSGGLGVAFVVALALTLVTVTWGPIVPNASGQDTPGSDDVVGVGEPPWRAWRTEQVDDRGSGPDIAFTSEDEPRIFYFDPDAGVTVASPTLNGWEQDLVSSAAWEGDVAVDGEDTVWVSYIRKSAGAVFVAKKPVDSDSWSITRVADALPTRPTLTLEGGDNPHLLYLHRSEENFHLNHSYRTADGGYVTEKVLTGNADGQNFRDIALAAGPNPGDGVHAVFRQLDENDDYEARYAEYDPATEAWSFTWLDDCGAWDIDIAVDTDNTPHVACQGNNGGLVHYERVDGTWESNLAADGSDAVPPRSDNRMAEDAAIGVQDGTVHMAWRTLSDPFFPDNPFKPMQLYYTSRVDGEYTTEHADASGTGVGSDPSVSVCEDGTPWIAYEYDWRVRSARSLDGVNPSRELHVATPTVGAASTACGSLMVGG